MYIYIYMMQLVLPPGTRIFVDKSAWTIQGRVRLWTGCCQRNWPPLCERKHVRVDVMNVTKCSSTARWTKADDLCIHIYLEQQTINLKHVLWWTTSFLWNDHIPLDPLLSQGANLHDQAWQWCRPLSRKTLQILYDVIYIYIAYKYSPSSRCWI